MNQLRLLMLATIAICGLWTTSASAQTQRQIIVTNSSSVVDPDKPLRFITYLELPFNQIILLPDPQKMTKVRPSSVQPASYIVPASAETTPATSQQIISVPVYSQPVVTVPVYVEPDPYDNPYYYQPWVIPARGINRSNWGLDNARPVGMYRR